MKKQRNRRKPLGMPWPEWIVRNSMPTPTGCRVWMGWVDPSNGYGQMHVQRPDGRRSSARPHRVLWAAYYGHEIPHKGTLHHICGNRLCVLPLHLWLMDRGEHGVYQSRLRLTISQFAAQHGPRAEQRLLELMQHALESLEIAVE